MPVLRAEQVADVLRRGSDVRMAATQPAAFAPGQRVLARNLNPPGHTRIPRYVRGRPGVVVSDRGVFVFPDAHAAGRREPQRLYSVRFESSELWGPDAPPAVAVYLDMFEPYLEPA